MIVPVRLSHMNSADERLVYALILDTQSDTSFILPDTCSRIELQETSVKLGLSTMTAENTVIDSEKDPRIAGRCGHMTMSRKYLALHLSLMKSCLLTEITSRHRNYVEVATLV